jgi:hypothetical protein
VSVQLPVDHQKYLKCLIIDNLITLEACTCPLGRISMLCVEILKKDEVLWNAGAGLGAEAAEQGR